MKTTIKPGDEYITLELTMKEAQALFVVCGRVAGPHDGYRGCTTAIRKALLQLGFESHPEQLIVGAPIQWKAEYDKID